MVERIEESHDIGTPVEFRRVTIALWRQRWLVAGAAVVGTIAGTVIAKALVEPVFETRCVVECDRCSQPDLGDRELATLQETVKLPQHMEFARQKLGLSATLESIDRNVEVSASIESRLIHVTARGKTGDLAAGLANTIVDSFLETRLHIERDKLDARLASLKTDAENANAMVAATRTKYDRFRRENNITDLPAERLAAIQEVARLRTELAIARGEEQAAEARALALRRVSDGLPTKTIMQEVEAFPDAKRLAETRAELSSAGARLTEDHPRVRVLSAEEERLERRIAERQEIVTTGRTIAPNPRREIAEQGIMEAGANREAASIRQSTYERLARDAAQAAARLSAVEGQASELLSNVENAERHATTIKLDLSLAEDAARAPSTGLRVLAPAQAPSMPIASPRRVIAILGPILGAIMAAIVVVLFELRGIRICTASELSFWGKAPTIASSPWPRSPLALHDLANDLTESIRYSSGMTLVLNASTHEMPHVEVLVQNVQERLREKGSTDESASSTIKALMLPDSMPTLRHALRAGDRLIVVVVAENLTARTLQRFVEKIAYSGPMGFVLLGLRAEHKSFADLVGDVDAFWNSQSPRPKLTKQNAQELGVIQ